MLKGKVLLWMALMAATAVSMAQTPALDGAARVYGPTPLHRDASQRHLELDFPLADSHVHAAKSADSLPDAPTWVPGEWEEVQAVVVAPLYSYRSPDGRQLADPLVGSIADYYANANAQRPSGHGPYLAMLDTADGSAVAEAIFRVVDAIQEGGAQAWIRLEADQDSALVQRKLARMGLRSDNLRFFTARGNSIWCRDSGPVCFYYGSADSIGMLDFDYYPARALDDSLPQHLAHHFGYPCYRSTLEWEGGNCLVDGAGMVVTSDHMYRNNADNYGPMTWDGTDYSSIAFSRKEPLESAQARDMLQGLVGQRATHVVPTLRYDGGTGHLDIYLGMADENTFLFSNMPALYNRWADYRISRSNIDSLCSYHSLFGETYACRNLPFPVRNDGSRFANQKDYTYYTRTYANRTVVNGLIIQPCFSEVDSNGMPTASWDSLNIEQLKAAYPGYRIYCIDARGFDGTGGSIHCITTQIPAEAPLRILHRSLRDTLNVGLLDSLPVSAIVTHRSGVAHAEVVYRQDGGEWHTDTLVANGNRHHGRLPLKADSVLHTIEYYIAATSVDGKHITKPFTAAQGGCYTFAYTAGEGEADSTQFDFDTAAVDASVITFAMESPAVTGITPVAADDAESHFGLFYPNPASGRAELAIDLNEGTVCDVLVHDIGGRIIHTTQLQAAGPALFSLDTSRLSAGIYTVVFQTNGARVARKLLVN